MTQNTADPHVQKRNALIRSMETFLNSDDYEFVVNHAAHYKYQDVTNLISQRLHLADIERNRVTRSVFSSQALCMPWKFVIRLRGAIRAYDTVYKVYVEWIDFEKIHYARIRLKENP